MEVGQVPWVSFKDQKKAETREERRKGSNILVIFGEGVWTAYLIIPLLKQPVSLPMAYSFSRTAATSPCTWTTEPLDLQFAFKITLDPEVSGGSKVRAPKGVKSEKLNKMSPGHEAGGPELNGL